MDGNDEPKPRQDAATSHGSETSPSHGASRGKPRNGAAAGSGAASSAAATSDPFLGDPGPAFDPGTADAGDDDGATVHALPEPAPLWTPERTKPLLRGQGAITHALVGVADTDWVWQESELQAAAEPLAGVLNKFGVTRAAAAVSDELALAEALIAYSTRSIRERQLELRARAAEDVEVPVTGRDAEGHTYEPPAAAPAAGDLDDDAERWRVE